MPKQTLTSRLEDLENEIRVLLTLQEVQPSGCQVLKGKSITKHADGDIEHIEFEGSTCPGFKSVCATCPPSCRSKSKSPPHKSSATAIEKEKPSTSHVRTSVDALRKPRKGYKATDKNDSEPEASQGDKAEQEKPKIKDAGAKQECQDLLEKLQLELKILEGKLHDTERQKEDALKTSENLKVNYEKLNANKNEESIQLENLKMERGELIRRLQNEQNERKQQEEEVRTAFEKEKRYLKNQVEKIELHAVTSAKKIKRHGNQLVGAVKKRDDHIRRLSDSTDKLASNILQKENENKRLMEAYEDTVQSLLESQHANKKLTQINAELLRSIQEFQDKLQMEKNCTQKITMQMEQCKSDSSKIREEMERLKARLKTALDGPKKFRHMARLEEKLRESREREQIWLDEAALMETKLKDLQHGQESSGKKFDNELALIQKDNTHLQMQYDKAVRQFEQLKADNDLRMIDMKSDFDKLVSELTKKLEAVQKDKGSLQNDFNQLVNASQRDRKALEDLITRTKQQDVLIKSQQSMLISKEQKIENGIRESNALKESLLQTDKKINTLKNSMEERKALSNDLEEETTNLRAQLEELRAGIMKKDELLTEYVNTIENLHSVITNTENKLKNEMKEAQLASEQAKNAIQQLQTVTNKLHQHEQSTIVHKRTASVKDSATKTLLQNAGEAVTMSTKEYDRKIQLLDQEKQLELNLMLRQKDQAVFAAKFATQKLLETVTDFQKQVVVHKQIQLMLTKMLQEKEDHIQSMKGLPPCAIRADQGRSKRPGSRGCGRPNCRNR